MNIPPDACPICRTALAGGTTGCRQCGFETLPSPLLAPPRRGQSLDPVLAAIAEWRARATRAPGEWRWPFLAGVGCLNLDLPDEALEDLRRAAQLAPEVAATHAVLAGALVADPYRIAEADADAARAALERALALAPALPAALALQRFLLARARRDQPQIAELMLQDAMASWPTCAVFPFELAITLGAIDEVAQAEQVLRTAIGNCRGALPLHASLSLLLWRQGRYAEGRDAGLQGLELAAESRARDTAVVHNNIALCLHGLGRHAEARTQFEHALALDTDNPSIARNLQVLADTVHAQRVTTLRRRWIGGAAAAFAILAVLIGVQVVLHEETDAGQPDADANAGIQGPAATTRAAAPGVISPPHGDDAQYLIGLFEAHNASRKVRSYRLTSLRHGTVPAVNAGYVQDGAVTATLGCLDMVTVQPAVPDSGALDLRLCGYVVDGPPGGSARIWWGSSADELAPVMDDQGFHGT